MTIKSCTTDNNWYNNKDDLYSANNDYKYNVNKINK